MLKSLQVEYLMSETLGGRTGGVAQLVECLLSLCEALGLIAQHHINQEGWCRPLSPSVRSEDRRVGSSRSASVTWEI